MTELSDHAKYCLKILVVRRHIARPVRHFVIKNDDSQERTYVNVIFCGVQRTCVYDSGFVHPDPGSHH